MKSLLQSLLAVLFLVSSGCSGSRVENDQDDPAASGDSQRGDSQVSAAGDVEQPEKPNPRLRRDDINLSVGYLNVEGGGSDANSVAKEFIYLDRFHVIGFSSVDNPKVFEEAVNKKWPKNFDKFISKTGKISGKPNQHLMLMYDYNRLYLVSKTELDEYNGTPLTGGNLPAPLVAHLRDKTDDEEFVVVLVHFSRDDGELRRQQVKGLLEWARKASQPVVLIGTMNFEFDVAAQAGNQAFDDLQSDGVWKWVRPLEMRDTTWIDEDGDGGNDVAGELFDFVFVSGQARNWPATCRILTRSRDFPDDEKSTNHRPMEVVLKTKR